MYTISLYNGYCLIHFWSLLLIKCTVYTFSSFLISDVTWFFLYVTRKVAPLRLRLNMKTTDKLDEGILQVYLFPI